MQIAGVGEVSDVGEIRSLAHFQSADRFRNQEIQVGVALTVRVGGQIDRQVVPEYGHVGAVVEIVAAQIVLVGLAGAGVLHDGEAGCRFEDFRTICDRPSIEVLARDGHLARQLRHHRRSSGHVRTAGVVG
jgi:hypothetical protein